MKLRLTFIFCVLSFIISAQRGVIPQNNPDNALDLKVVFQEYTITTTYSHGGRTTQKGKYLNLKVNDLYLKDGYTGIDQPTFRKYLSNCPQALDYGLQGLDKYDESNKFYRIGNYIMFGGFATGAYLALSDGFDIDKGTITKLFVPAVTAWAGRYFFARKAKRLEKGADDLVVEAFGYYSDNCYRPDLDNSSAYEPLEQQAADNGESNTKEKVMIDVLSNNPRSKFLTIGGLLGMSSFDSPNITLGPDVSYYKEGLYLNGHAYLSRYAPLSEPEGIDPQYGGYLLASVPFIKRVKKPKTSYLSLGSMQGFDSTAESNDSDLQTFAAVSFDLGISHNQQYVSEFGNFAEYFQKASMIRAGISRTIFSETTFNVEDNRYSDETRYQVGFGRLYVNALYNLNTDLNTDFVTSRINDIPEVKDYGFAFGIELKGTTKRKKGAILFNLEGGLYPYGWGGRFGLGFSLYSVDRKKIKARKRKNTDSSSKSSRTENKRRNTKEDNKKTRNSRKKNERQNKNKEKDRVKKTNNNDKRLSRKKDNDQAMAGRTNKEHSTKKADDKKLALESEYAPKYDGGGPLALMDKKRGGKDYRNSGWQGYEGKDIIAVVDLGNKQEISELRMGFLQDEDASIFMPTQLDVYVGDEDNWELYGSLTNDKITPEAKGTIIKDFVVKGEAKSQYVKVVAKSLGNSPENHKDSGNKCWIFSDEIVIK